MGLLSTEPHSQPRAVSVKEERGEMWKREEEEKREKGAGEEGKQETEQIN